MNTSYTYANRFVEWPDRVFGLMRFHSNASWVDNRTALATTPHLYDYAGNVMDSIAVDKLGGGADSYRNWFSECVDGLRQRADPADVPRRRGRDDAAGRQGRLHRRQPRRACDRQAAVHLRTEGRTAEAARHPLPRHRRDGKFTSPTWSPDGKSLAWADKKGIWVGRVGDISGQTCQLTKTLVIPGGSSPDWGPAKP